MIKTITEYIKSAPKETQPKLKQMLAAVRMGAPGAEEGIKWSMPALSYKRILVAFAFYKHHIGFYPTPSAVIKFKKDLTKYKTAKGSIQFPLDKPLPLMLVKKITAFRAKEATQQDAKWRTTPLKNALHKRKRK